MTTTLRLPRMKQSIYYNVDISRPMPGKRKPFVTGYYYPFTWNGPRFRIYTTSLKSVREYESAVQRIQGDKANRFNPETSAELFDYFRPESSMVKAMRMIDQACEYPLNYKVELCPIKAREFAYRSNDLDLLDMFHKIDNAIPVMDLGMINGEENGNNGKPSHTYLIGREYSRVVYVQLITTQSPTGTNCLNSVQDFTRAVRDAVSTFKPDEFTFMQPDDLTWQIRLWWD